MTQLKSKSTNQAKAKRVKKTFAASTHKNTNTESKAIEKLSQNIVEKRQEYLCNVFPELFIDTINSSNFKNLRKIIDNAFIHQYGFKSRALRDFIYRDEAGIEDPIVNYFTAVQESFPDGILMLKKYGIVENGDLVLELSKF